MYRHAEAIYCYSSHPRVIPNYRPPRCICKGIGEEEECIINYGNIMYDRRIVRGSTYGRKVVTDRGCPDYSKPSQKVKKESSTRQPAEARGPALVETQPGTPIPMQGRQNKFMQTEEIMKELLHFGEGSDAQCQTEPFTNRPPRPFLITAKTGFDMATQVLPEELFNFDVEVSAPVWVLVEKVMEQSLMEVMEEEELASLWMAQNEFLERRIAERVEEERLEEAERRNRAEKEKHMKLKEEKLKLEKETIDKLACHVFSVSYLSGLTPAVFGCLTENGYFYNTVERNVEFDFLPWLMSTTQERLAVDVAARTIIDHLLCREVHRRIKEEAKTSKESTHPETEENFEEKGSMEIDVVVDDDDDATKSKPELHTSDIRSTEDEEEEENEPT